MEDLTYTVLDRKQREVSLTFTAEIKRKKKDRKLILKNANFVLFKNSDSNKNYEEFFFTNCKQTK